MALYGQCRAGAQINFAESGRGLGHVTPTIFGSTVGYPSDSLASCFFIAYCGSIGYAFRLRVFERLAAGVAVRAEDVGVCTAVEFVASLNHDALLYASQPYTRSHAQLYQNPTVIFYSFDARCCPMGAAIKHPVPDRVKPSFVICDIRAL